MADQAGEDIDERWTLRASDRVLLGNKTGTTRLGFASASASNSACASAISGISGVGEKPSSAGARTAWASAGRPVD